jgi:hypothetical protein
VQSQGAGIDHIGDITKMVSTYPIPALRERAIIGVSGMIVDMNGKSVDPPVQLNYVSIKDHNELVDAHNLLVHEVALLKLRIENRKWWQLWKYGCRVISLRL